MNVHSRPRAPYILIGLDNVLALYAGVSPNEPIGEPVGRAWQLLDDALDKGYEVRVLTWREPSLVWAWMDRAKKVERYRAQWMFDIVNFMPTGLPVCTVMKGDDMTSMAQLSRRV